MRITPLIAALSAMGIASAAAAGSKDGPTPCTAASAIPTCAIPCITAAATAIGCAGPDDYACQCSQQGRLQVQAGACVLEACGFVTALQVKDAASTICRDCVGGGGKKEL